MRTTTTDRPARRPAAVLLECTEAETGWIQVPVTGRRPSQTRP